MNSSSATQDLIPISAEFWQALDRYVDENASAEGQIAIQIFQLFKDQSTLPRPFDTVPDSVGKKFLENDYLLLKQELALKLKNPWIYSKENLETIQTVIRKLDNFQRIQQQMKDFKIWASSHGFELDSLIGQINTVMLQGYSFNVINKQAGMIRDEEKRALSIEEKSDNNMLKRVALSINVEDIHTSVLLDIVNNDRALWSEGVIKSAIKFDNVDKAIQDHIGNVKNNMEFKRLNKEGQDLIMKKMDDVIKVYQPIFKINAVLMELKAHYKTKEKEFPRNQSYKNKLANIEKLLYILERNPKSIHNPEESRKIRDLLKSRDFNGGLIKSLFHSQTTMTKGTKTILDLMPEPEKPTSAKPRR